MDKLNNYNWLFSIIGLFLIITVIYILSHKRFKGDQVLTISETVYNEMVLEFEKEDALIQRDFIKSDSSTSTERQERNTRLTAKLLAQLKFDAQPEIYKRFDSLNQTEPMLPAKLIDRLPQEVVKKRTWFWFYGNKRYLEVLFWAMFGVICSLLFNVTQSLKTHELDVRLIPDHIAKLFYGPVVALVIYFSFDKVSDTELINIVPEGFGLVVLSFILGFFSRRSMAVLNNLKKIVVPITEKKKGQSGLDSTDSSNGQLADTKSVALKELESILAKNKEEFIRTHKVDNVRAELRLVEGQSKPQPVVLVTANKHVDTSNITDPIPLGDKTFPVVIEYTSENLDNSE